MQYKICLLEVKNDPATKNSSQWVGRTFLVPIHAHCRVSQPFSSTFPNLICLSKGLRLQVEDWILPGVGTFPRTCSLLRTGSRSALGYTPENPGEALCTRWGFLEPQQYCWPRCKLIASGTVGQQGSGLMSFFFPQSNFCHTQAPSDGFVAESIYKKENTWALQKSPIQMLIASGLSNTVVR